MGSLASLNCRIHGLVKRIPRTVAQPGVGTERRGISPCPAANMEVEEMASRVSNIRGQSGSHI